MKCVSVLNKNQLAFYHKTVAKKQGLHFWLSNKSPYLNICTLQYVTMEYVELNQLCKHVKISGVAKILFQVFEKRGDIK